MNALINIKTSAIFIVIVMTEDKRKKKRNSKEIQDALFKATEALVISKGFNNVLVTEIMELAEVEPKVMYKQFSNINDLFDNFIRRYDYWFLDLCKLHIDKKKPKESFKALLRGLINSLYDNPIIQKILIWELSTKNDLTKRTALNREVNSNPLLKFYENHLGENFDYFSSLLISGIYYLTSYKDISTFCEIDYNKKESKQLLIDIVERIVDSYYGTDNSTSFERKGIILSLLKNGVDIDVISKSTGLSVSEIEELNKQNT